ncbi:hypothetical protein SAMN06314019_1028 [Epsilonproteobacteria bacterium SCGC AD-311-C15]|jgi:hypothetical protein|nr:hypothetical protein SAMN06314019_1028 [Epsilonproteobacteria bacterium SCGC AD-311-C15]
MIKNIFLALTLTSLSLFAYSDSDMDGVEDKTDQCPNTSFTELVDINGCSIESLEYPHHFDVIVGLNYSQTNYETNEKTDTFTKSVQLDYYYKDFSIQANTAHYNSDSNTYNDSGMNDSFLGAYYKLEPIDSATIRLGGGIIFPSYDSDLKNNNTDYTASLNLSYMLKNINLFGGYSYTIINDDDVHTTAMTVEYQNTNAYNLGLGFYPTSKLYVSGAYNSSDSIYKGVESIDTASVNAFYTIDKNWFTIFNYAYGLSDSASDNDITVSVGYYF